MTTIDARPPGSRASAHRFGVLWAVALPLLAAVAAHSTGRVWPAVFAVAIVAGVAARHDVRRGIIPDPAVVSAAAVPALMALAGYCQGARTWVDVVVGTAVMSVPMLVLHAVDPRLIGFGDVKLAAALGAGLGLVDPRLGLIALAVAAVGSLYHAVGTGAHRVPFAPALLAGFTVSVLMASGESGAAR